MLSQVQRLTRMPLRNSWRALHSQPFTTTLKQERQYEDVPFDMLIEDINKNELQERISKMVNKDYLRPLRGDEQEFQKCRIGSMYGYGCRGIISLPTRLLKESPPVWVHYFINPASPYNYLSEDALIALNADLTQGSFFKLRINGLRCSAELSKSHFKEVNMIGMNYLKSRASLFYNLDDFRITLSFFDVE